MSDNPRPPIVPPVANFTRADDFHYVYANTSRVRVGPGEVTLIFAYQDEAPGVGLILTETSSVTITPTHAKRLTAYLIETLRGYEEAFGKIPPEGTEPVDQGKLLERVTERLAAWDST